MQFMNESCVKASGDTSQSPESFLFQNGALGGTLLAGKELHHHYQWKTIRGLQEGSRWVKFPLVSAGS